MAIVPQTTSLTNISNLERLAVPLPRYAQIIQYPEAQFYNVRDNDTLINSVCKIFWSKEQRDFIAHYLLEAQQEIENVVGYPLTPTWITGLPTSTADDRFVDNQRYLPTVIAKWSKVIQPGIRAIGDIALAQAVSFANDPAIIGPIATTVTNVNEIKVYYPATTAEIVPSLITISAGFVTISIPRVRMVRYDLAQTNTTIDYLDTSFFQQTVDIKRLYNDNSVNATFVRYHNCNSLCSSLGCQEYTETACMVIEDYTIGAIKVRRGSYSNGTWSPGGICSPRPLNVRLNYQAGLQFLTQQMEDTVIRLAHSKMATEPCGCDVVQFLWKRDRNIPQVLTAERLNCPFGISDGAWIAWKFANAQRVVRAMVFGRF